MGLLDFAYGDTQQGTGKLNRLASLLQAQQALADRKNSVMSQPSQGTWQPDNERAGGHALEAPMISPDDLIGTGIPSKLAGLLGAGVKAAAAHSGSAGLLGAILGSIKSVGKEAPQAEALRLAQIRAALTTENGGLGLHAGNTALDRAMAMGFDTEVFRGTGKEFSPDDPSLGRVIEPSMKTYLQTDDGTPIRKALFTSTSPDVASGYAFAPLSNFKELLPDAQVFPLMVNKGKSAWSDARGREWSSVFGRGGPESNAGIARNAGYDSYTMKNVIDSGQGNGALADTVAMINSDNIRSRFAAFDPWRRSAAIAAAMGVAAPDLLAVEK